MCWRIIRWREVIKMRDEVLERLSIKYALEYFQTAVSEHGYPKKIDEINELEERVIGTIELSTRFQPKEKYRIIKNLEKLFEVYKDEVHEFHKAYA